MGESNFPHFFVRIIIFFKYLHKMVIPSALHSSILCFLLSFFPLPDILYTSRDSIRLPEPDRSRERRHGFFPIETDFDF